MSSMKTLYTLCAALALAGAPLSCASSRDPNGDLDSGVQVQRDAAVVVDGAVAGDSGQPADAAVSTPDAMADATVVGPCPGTAAVLINEVNTNIPNGRDLVELRVTAGGPLMGMRLVNGNASSTLVNLPAICAAAGDIVVLHLSPIGSNGNSIASETTSKTQYPMAASTANYDSAWDVNQDVTATGIAFTDTVLLLRRADTSLMDVAILSNVDGTSSATYITAVESAQAASGWLPATCGTAQCQDVAADFSTVSDLVTGTSIQRTGATDTNMKTDWTVKAQTWGAAN